MDEQKINCILGNEHKETGELNCCAALIEFILSIWKFSLTSSSLLGRNY